MRQDFDIARRRLLKLLGCAAAGLAGCAPAETPREGIARLLDLDGAEQQWLNVLDEREQRELYDILSDPQPETMRRAERLMMKVLSPRSRLFAFVGYPAAADRRTGCDGLVFE